MADVKWVYYIYRDKPGAGNAANYRPDADLRTQVENVDLTDITDQYTDWFTICSDQTTVAAAGTIHRTIIAELSADFEADYPSEATQIAALKKMYEQALAKRIPYMQVNEDVFIGALCP